MNRFSGLRALLQSRWGPGVLAVFVAAAVLLVFDHWPHIVESNLALGGLLLAGVAMHLFVHGGHGGHGGSVKGDQ
jgi:hypothetical protein